MNGRLTTLSIVAGSPPQCEDRVSVTIEQALSLNSAGQYQVVDTLSAGKIIILIILASQLMWH